MSRFQNQSSTASKFSVTDQPKTVIVMGLDDFHRRELATIRDAERFTFKTLFDPEDIVNRTDLDAVALLEEAEQRLDDFESDGNSIDGIIGHWDFPVTSLVPLLCKRRGLPGPSLDSVCKCTDKYWSRLVQQECIPECTPRFQAIDPFAEDVEKQIELPYPFWIKPVKAYASGLGFRIEDAEQLHGALEEIRENIGGIGEPFEDLLELMEVPREILDVGGCACLVEEVVGGREIAPEGYVHNGKVHINGLIDMPRHEGSFDRYEYPAAVDKKLQQRIKEITQRLITYIGYDNACFNVEYFYDEEQDRLSVIEINPRISQSHSYLFDRVDGTSNHELAVKVAIDEEPQFAHSNGRYGAAAKCMVRVRHKDGVVRSIPSDEDLRAIEQDFPGCLIELEVEKGSVLSELPEQDTYSYCIANVYACGEDHEDMLERYREIVERLDIDIKPRE